MSLLQTAALLGSLVASAAAHGHVQGIVVDGIWYDGYDPSYQYLQTPPTLIAWSVPEDLGNGFIDPNNYTTQNIICHLDATPGGTSAKAQAGGVVEFQWTPWPSSHHGPVIDYLAKCDGSCSSVDKTKLEFFKIDAVGLVDDSDVPGTWGSDQLIANNNSWAVTIPKDIAPGNYVMRHEIIALHSAEEADGAQNYPQCINLEITGSGTASPSGTLGEKLYHPSDAGILIDIYSSLSTYKIPGPTLISGAVSMKQTEVSFGGAAPTAGSSAASTTKASTTSVAAATSTPASTSAAPSTTSTTAAATSAVSAAKKPNSSKTPKPATHKPQPTTISSSSCTKSTITVTRSSAVSVAAVSSSAPGAPSPYSAPAAASSASSAVSVAAASASPSLPAALSSLVSALPTGALTHTIPPLPTGTGGVPYPSGSWHHHAHHGSGNGTMPGGLGGMPSKPLPPGFTMKDLLEWLAFMMAQMFREGEHGRDFEGRR